MYKLLISNFLVLKNAIGVEPFAQILMNGIRKLIGRPPQHRSLTIPVSSTDVEPTPRLIRPMNKYEEYLSQKSIELCSNKNEAEVKLSMDIIWVIETNNLDQISSTYSDLENQLLPAAKIILVCEDVQSVPFSNKEKFTHIDDALLQCKSSYVAFIHGTPRVHPAYTREILKYAQSSLGVDLLYACEDTISKEGVKENPQFKPQLNQFLMYSRNYIGRNVVVRQAFGLKQNWFKKTFASAYVYDFILRSIDAKAKIERVDEILISHYIKEESEDLRERKRSLGDHLRRIGEDAKILDGIESNTTRLQRSTSESKLVSIIIPFKDQVELLIACVESVIEKTQYSNYEIILVNNRSQEDRTFRFLEEIRVKHNFVDLLTIDAPFNFSYLNNEAVKVSKGEYLLFLNNDTEVISEGWLKALVTELERGDVGIVGGKLLYEDNTVQHAGVILGVGHVAGHAFRNIEDDAKGHSRRANATQEFLAVTGACLLTKKELFKEVNGFDEENLKIAYNDVDYCLKIQDLGYKVVYTPHAKLYHYESKSRASDISEAEIERYSRECAFMNDKWKDKYYNDPFFHPHLDNRYENFENLK